MAVFLVWIVFILLHQKINLNHMKYKENENKDFCNVNMPDVS